MCSQEYASMLLIKLMKIIISLLTKSQLQRPYLCLNLLFWAILNSHIAYHMTKIFPLSEPKDSFVNEISLQEWLKQCLDFLWLNTLELNYINHIIKKLTKTSCVMVAVYIGRLVICFFVAMGENQLLLHLFTFWWI